MSVLSIIHLVICASVLELSIEDPDVQSSLSEVQRIVDAAYWHSTLAGAVAVVIVTQNVTVYDFKGTVDVNNTTAPNEHTLFEIGSISKAFTGLLLADQVLAGNVSLNDTLAKLLTDWPGRFASAAGNVTLLELTTHSSGLPRLPDNFFPVKYPDNPYVDYTEDKLYKWLDKVQLSNRSSFLYSNAGAAILGHALALAAGKTYEDLLKERILLPLGLNDTTISLNDDQKKRMAVGHDSNGTIVGNWDFDVLAPAGAWRSSISEFVHFLRFAIGIDVNENDTGLRKALEFATQPRFSVDQNTSIGCNWFLLKDKSFVYHGGQTGGYSSYIGWDPREQIGVGKFDTVNQ